MCLIAISGKGTEKNSEFFFEALITASKRNTDGIGYAIKRNNDNQIFYSKGHQDIKKVIDEIRAQDLKLEDELVVHLRKISAGPKSAENCHPFICSYDADYVNDCGPSKTVCPVVFHNGHFNHFRDKSNLILSDTHIFTRDFLRNKDIQSMLKDNPKNFQDTFSFILGTNRLAILFKDRNIITIGSFIEDKKYLFSNNMYKDGTSIQTNIQIPDRTPANSPYKKGDTLLKLERADREFVELNVVTYPNIILVAKEDIPMYQIKKNQKFTVPKFKDDDHIYQITDFLYDHDIYWVNRTHLFTCFNVLKRLSKIDCFDDYDKLVKFVKPVSKTVQKKLYKTLDLAKGKWLSDTTQIFFEYKNRSVNVRYDAFMMFSRYCNYILDESPFIDATVC